MIFYILGVEKSKNRDRYIVEPVILHLLVFFICIFIQNVPAKFSQFSVKSGL